MIPGATVTLVNPGTGFSRTVVSDTRGEYSALFLPTGTYTVSAEMTGFSKVSMANVHLASTRESRSTSSSTSAR